jgi:hypothetical protein
VMVQQLPQPSDSSRLESRFQSSLDHSLADVAQE